jgi:hypothetical protein
MRTWTCILVVCVCGLAYVAGCESSVKVTRDGKAMRGPVSVVVIRDFTMEPGVKVPEDVVQGITSNCVQSLGTEGRIKRATGNHLPEGAIDVRGRFKRYRTGTWTLQAIGSPGAPVTTMDLTELKVQISVHDVATGKLLASKVVEDQIVSGLYDYMTGEVKNILLAYFTASGRRLAE